MRRSRSSSTTAFALASVAARFSWAWMALSLWLTSRTFGAGTWLKTLMNHTPLPLGLRQKLANTLHQAPASVRCDQFDGLQPAVDEVAQKGRPAGLIFLRPLADAEDL